MKMTIKLAMDNAAFGDDLDSKAAEVRRILQALAWSLNDGFDVSSEWERTLRDSNGNAVGVARVVEG